MSDQEDHLANVLKATGLGALIGAGIGWGACVFVIDDPLLFPGDTILFGAILCGLLGYVFGDSFVDRLQDRWWWFW